MKHQRRLPRSVENERGYCGRCPDCGKLQYRSRAGAKLAAKRGQQTGLGITRVYKCGEYWHLTSQDTATTTRQRERS